MALTTSWLTTNSVASMTTIKDFIYKVGNSYINNNNVGVTDPDQKLISLGELKKILEEYDREVKRNGEDRHPSLKKDLCLALGMKYGLKCDDSATENTSDLRSVTSSKSGNFHKILQILNEGEVVERNTFSGNSDKVFNRQKLESLLQKYMKPIKKLSEQFPNREIELQFEIDGNKGHIVASPKAKYVRVPAALIPQLNPVSDVSTPNVMALTPSWLTTNSVASMTTIKDFIYKVGNSYINNNNVGDPDQKLISLGELKKILEEYDREVKRNGEDRHPSLKKDLCLALGMKYGLKCDDSATENTSDLRSVTSSKSGNFHKILQILNEGEVVERNTFSGNSKENLYWFKIKFPK
ncbi:PREDICTED: uncharacterized protein LOC106126521 [Papilio xuthus]|uniref:Uncharacterized protein LOC106126521 n=1 Tax=Papilio xuthus TaxID=66420 RepID=A0AAJ7EJG7_PAPXU|nr:PREDICTED: uncharacterized protein LOC106126521 [Papilio xuthus]